MSSWITANGNRHNVNLEDDLIKAMKKKGARFCWMRDTPGIKNKDNEMFYKTKTETNEDGSEESYRCFREGITVTTENGEQVTGYITHWVINDGNKTAATDIQDWFIFQPGTYPTRYIIEKNSDEMIITEF